MTGWDLGIKPLCECPDYAPSKGILGQITPGLCVHIFIPEKLDDFLRRPPSSLHNPAST